VFFKISPKPTTDLHVIRRATISIQETVKAVVSLLFSLLLFSSSALAASSEWVNSDFSQIRLIAVQDGDKGLRAGLHIRLDPDWKTYWRSPGDSGVPTVVDWAGSKNVDVAGISWPVPKRMVLSGYQSIVYQDEVVLLLDARTGMADQPVHLAAEVNYAVCKDICVPLLASLYLELRPGQTGKGDRVHARLLDRFRARVPQISTVPTDHSAQARDLNISAVDLLAANGKQVLEVVLDSKDPLGDTDIFAEAPVPYSFSPPKVKFSPDRRQARFSFAVNGGVKNQSLGGIRVTLTAVHAGQGIEAGYLLNKNPE